MIYAVQYLLSPADGGLEGVVVGLQVEVVQPQVAAPLKNFALRLHNKARCLNNAIGVAIVR